MTKNAEIAIITHGSPSIGGGHLSRCRALAEGFAFLGVAAYWIVNPEGAKFLADIGVSNHLVHVVDTPFDAGAEGMLSALSRISPFLSIVDGYDASPSFMEKVLRLSPAALIDDCRVRSVERECAVLLNYNLNGLRLGYEEGFAHLLLGPEFALLRREFWDLEPEEGHAILIIPGASDLLNTSGYFISWWGDDWPKADLVLGPLVDSAVAEDLTERASGLPNLSVVRNPPDLPDLMARSRAVVCTSSVTSYEALALRKPLIVFQTAENQEAIGAEIARLGLGANLGRWGEWGAADLKRKLDGPPPIPPASVNPKGALSAASELLRRG